MRATGVITADPNPIQVADSYGLGATTLRWKVEDVEAIEVRVDAPDGALFSRSGPVGSAETGPWVTDGMVFYLQNVSNGLPLTLAHTLAKVTLKVASAVSDEVAEQEDLKLPKLALRAERISLDGIEPVPLREIKKRVFRGEVIVVHKCLQAIGWLDKMEATSLTGIRSALGEAAAAAVARKGLQFLHEAIDPDDLPWLMKSLYEHYRPLTPVLARKVLHNALGINRGFYYEETVNVRFHVPFDFAAKNNDRRKLAEVWCGKVTPHCPHHDSWYECPVNAFNIWMALSPVKAGNGMTIFPEMFGKRLPCTKDGRMVANQFLGRPLNFTLDPGDALIFHGEHLHSSEINITDETRHVVSLRLTLDEPRYYGPSSAKFAYSAPPAGLWNRVSGLWGRRSAALRSLFNGKKPGEVVPAFADTSALFPKPLSNNFGAEHDANPSFDPAALPIGEIRPISKTHCAARLAVDQVVVFQRSCPHEGADLAGGRIKDGCVICPWHNLPIDLTTGASPCSSLRKIKVLP